MTLVLNRSKWRHAKVMNTYSFVLQERRIIAEDTLEVTLRPREEMFNFLPGQHVDIELSRLLYDDPRGRSRSFSIVSSPNNKDTLIIAFRVSESGFKRTLSELPMGTKVTVQGPSGNFVLPEGSARPIVLIAGGIGITPLMSIIRFATEEHSPTDLTLLFFNTDPKRIAYLPELEELKKNNQHFALKKRFGDINATFLKESTSGIQEPLWYVVGPPAMVEAAHGLLHGTGVQEKDIMLEEMSGYKGTPHLVSRLESTIVPKRDSIAAVSAKMSESLLQMLDNAALVSITDKDGNIIYANNLFRITSKYSHEELVGQNHRILKSGGHPDSFYKELWDTVSSGNIWRGEIKNKAKDGSFYWVDSVIAPLFDNEGNIVNYISVRFPVTGRKEAEQKVEKKSEELTHTVEEMETKNRELENVRKAALNILEDLDEEKKAIEEKVRDRTKELEQERNKLLQVTSNMRGGGILFDKNRKVIFVNKKARELLHMDNDARDQDVLDTFLNIFRDTDTNAYLERCFNGDSFEVPEVDEGERVFQLFFHSIENTAEESGGSAGYFLLFIDVTEEKLLERSKSELVAVASHQLRTPLTAMRGNVEMLRDENFGTLNKEQHELLEDVEVSTIRLITMVNDMLDITRIEKGDLELNIEQLNIQEIIQSVIDDLSDYAKRHEFTVHHNVPEQQPNVCGDRVRIRQIFQNLIDNAIKYSRHPGELHINYTLSPETVEVVLKDNGIGIPQAEQSKMFGRFYRASNTSKMASSGSGLGLYIVKSIIKQMHGDIRFESEENIGTTFFVTLPTKEIKT